MRPWKHKKTSDSGKKDKQYDINTRSVIVFLRNKVGLCCIRVILLNHGYTTAHDKDWIMQVFWKKKKQSDMNSFC